MKMMMDLIMWLRRRRETMAEVEEAVEEEETNTENKENTKNIREIDRIEVTEVIEEAEQEAIKSSLERMTLTQISSRTSPL